VTATPAPQIVPVRTQVDPLPVVGQAAPEETQVCVEGELAPQAVPVRVHTVGAVSRGRNDIRVGVGVDVT
jgi:hypothetical protein